MPMRDEAGDIEIVKFLLEQGCDIKARDFIGKTLLNYASENGSVELVQYLIAHGADVNSRDNEGYSPLDGATTDDVAVALLQSGADPTVYSNGGANFCEVALGVNFPKAEAWLQGHGFVDCADKN